MKTILPARFARVLLALLPFCSPAAFAATATWTSAPVSGDSDVVGGTVYFAANIGGSTGGDFSWGPGVATTVNGVSFQGVYLNTLATIDTVDSTIVQFSSRTASSVGTGLRVSYGNATTFGTGPAFTGLSSAYQALLGSGAYSGGPEDNTTLTFWGLTIGTAYQFQWWSNDSRSLATGRTVTATAGNSVTLASNTSVSGAGLGQYAVGSFTADATSQSFAFTGNNGVMINGFQLTATAVPEPSTYATLAGVVAVGAVAYRRRSRVTHRI